MPKSIFFGGGGGGMGGAVGPREWGFNVWARFPPLSGVRS